jgi:hypothetical protein
MTRSFYITRKNAEWLNMYCGWGAWLAIGYAQGFDVLPT